MSSIQTRAILAQVLAYGGPFVGCFVLGFKFFKFFNIGKTEEDSEDDDDDSDVAWVYVKLVLVEDFAFYSLYFYVLRGTSLAMLHITFRQTKFRVVIGVRFG